VLAQRLLGAISLIVFVAVVAWLQRDGFVDQTAKDALSFLDDDPRAAELEAGDRVIALRSHRQAA